MIHVGRWTCESKTKLAKMAPEREARNLFTYLVVDDKSDWHIVDVAWHAEVAWPSFADETVVAAH